VELFQKAYCDSSVYFTGLFTFVKTGIIGHSFTLGKKERLKSRKLIERVFREGKSFALHPLRVYYLPLEKGADPNHLAKTFRTGSAGSDGNGPVQPGKVRTPERLQAGFGASSRNFKKAVDRNRIKRLLREAYRLQKEALHKNLFEKDRQVALFFIYTGKELPDYATVYEKIGLTLQRLIKETGR
jgi:ribonuclease P protein component